MTGTSASSTDTAQENQRFWDQILPLLEEGRVVPVVGRDLLDIEVDGQRANLYAHLSARLARRLGISEPAPRTLDEVACRFMAEYAQPLEDLYPALKKVLTELEKIDPPSVLRQLAGIGWFRLFVSTTFDNFLVRAIDVERHGGRQLTTSLDFGLMNNFKDLPDDVSTLTRPVVYQLLGRASAVQDTYAVTDEDLLEFVHTLQTASQRPRRLFEALENSHLLLIGSGFSPWLVRFFLRAVKHRNRLWQVRGRAGFLVDQAARDDPGFLGFLRHYSSRTLVYNASDSEESPTATHFAEQFVVELRRHWDASKVGSNGDAEPPVERRSEQQSRHAVFISYASEDRPIVERLRGRLDAAGIDTWFDRSELQPGQTWSREIETHIDAAAVFLPVISASVFGDGGREFRVEWERALKALERRPRSANGAPAEFIVPVVIDDTAMTALGVTQYFGGTHAATAPGGEMDAALTERLRSLVRASQLSGRSVA